MTTTVTIYSRPNCQACYATTAWLDLRKVPYTVEPLADHPAILAAAQDGGILEAPIVRVVKATGEVSLWGGFRINHLATLIHLERKPS